MRPRLNRVATSDARGARMNCSYSGQPCDTVVDSLRVAEGQRAAGDGYACRAIAVPPAESGKDVREFMAASKYLVEHGD